MAYFNSFPLVIMIPRWEEDLMLIIILVNYLKKKEDSVFLMISHSLQSIIL